MRQDGRMAGPTKPLLAALEPHLGPVRRVLQDIEPNDLPAPMKKVAAYTGGRLPPPLLKSLVTELDRNEWLRDKVMEEARDQLDDIATAFLGRSGDWWLTIVDEVAAVAHAATEPDAGPQLEQMERRLAEAKRRVADLRDAKARLDAEVKELRRHIATHEKQVSSAGRIADLEDRLVSLESQLSAEQMKRRESEQRLDEIKRRRRKRRVQHDNGNGEARRVGLGDPVATARHLDLQAAALAAAVRGDPPPPGTDGPVDLADSPAPSLPAGIAPDTAGAIEWLLREAGPLPVILDGYNLTFLLDPDRFTAAATRQRLIGELERFLRNARSAHTVLLVFDSSETAAAAPTITHGGVEVSFATTADSADDEIVERVVGYEGRAVAITNDRALRERVEAEGAIALWGRAFVDWVTGGL